MPTTRDNRSVAAGATVLNILDGSLFENISRNGPLTIAAVAANATEVLMSVLAGTETLLEESSVPLEPAVGQGPNLQDHLILLEPVGRGDKITIRIRNTGAAARIVRTLISVP